MDVAALLEQLPRLDGYADQLVHVELFPERPGRFGSLSRPLSEPLQRALERQGIEQLYTHQVTCCEAARSGHDFVVVTGTASGKTLCYHLPILERSLAEPSSRALYLFPTKALAQDQLKGLLELLSGDEQLAGSIKPGVYDGDTPTAQRRRIRAESQLILSNPDMLHGSILPNHPKWHRFFSGLRYVVLDEIHTYRGILGAHVACVLRRLIRVCRHYGSNPVFLAASATVANPGEFSSRLLGRSMMVVDDDGAPRGRKFFALWNPAVAGRDQLARRSATDDAVWLMEKALEAGGQVLAFTRTRQATELIHRYVQDRMQRKGSPLARQLRAYRGGYLPEERRQIERDLFAGRLRGVAATNALELGIDIGSLDVALLVHYPGTFASVWQQAGRAGRRQGESLAVLLAGNDPIDQFLMRYPNYFFSQSPEHAVVDPENVYVLAKHLQAAAFELPLDEPTLAAFGSLASEIAPVLAEDGKLTAVDGRYYASSGQTPAHRISLRHMSDETFSIVEEKQDGQREVIANVDAISAPELVYPEAVYLHNGETYFVRKLDLNGKVAYVERDDMDYYTQAVLESSVRVVEARRAHDSQNTPSEAIARIARMSELGYGNADVSWKTVAFKKIKFSTRENIGFGSVDIPEQHLPTTASWIIPNDVLRGQLKQRGFRTSEALCGLRNLAIVALPVVAMCDSRDISGVVDSRNFGKSCLILYDRYPGGLGYCEKGFELVDQLLVLCHEMISQCPCEDGCPSCVGLPNLRPAIHSDPDLSRGYPIPDKEATKQLLNQLLESEPVHGSSPHLQTA